MISAATRRRFRFATGSLFGWPGVSMAETRPSLRSATGDCFWKLLLLPFALLSPLDTLFVRALISLFAFFALSQSFVLPVEVLVALGGG